MTRACRMTLADSLAHTAGCGQNDYETQLPFLWILNELQVK